MDNKIVEIFIPGPAGRLEAKYYKSTKNTSPIALVLQPHPQYGVTMNNKVVVDTFHTFMENNFSVCRDFYTYLTKLVKYRLLKKINILSLSYDRCNFFLRIIINNTYG